MTISSSSYSSSLLSTQSTSSTEQTKQKKPSIDDLISEVMSKNDANGDGLLTADELSGVSSENFSSMDTNGDGSLDSDELTSSFTSIMDSMKNQEITPEEFGSFLSSMGLDVPPPPSGGHGGHGGPNMEEMTTQIFDSKDTNGDGYLSADELGLDSDTFSSFDSDGDGNITKSEMQTGLKSLFDSAKSGEIDQDTFSSILDKLGVEAPPPPPPQGTSQSEDSSSSTTSSTTTSMEDYTLQLISTLIDAMQSSQTDSASTNDNSTLDLKKFKEVMNMVNNQTQSSQTANELSEFLKNLTSSLGTSSSSYA